MQLLAYGLIALGLLAAACPSSSQITEEPPVNDPPTIKQPAGATSNPDTPQMGGSEIGNPPGRIVKGVIAPEFLPVEGRDEPATVTDFH
jgi:hypothetical protein